MTGSDTLGGENGTGNGKIGIPSLAYKHVAKVASSIEKRIKFSNTVQSGGSAAVLCRMGNRYRALEGHGLYNYRARLG